MSNNASTQTDYSPLRRETCIICHDEDTLSRLIALDCSHVYHRDCIVRWWEPDRLMECPYCKAKTERYGHACGQPSACKMCFLPRFAFKIPAGPLPVALPCIACGQKQFLLSSMPDGRGRLERLCQAIWDNEGSLCSLLDPEEGTDLIDYRRWQKLDREEKAETGIYHYCQHNVSTTLDPAAATTNTRTNRGRRKAVYREQPASEADLDRVTRAELAYACDMGDFSYLRTAVKSRRCGTNPATWDVWKGSELPVLKNHQSDLRQYGERPMHKVPTLYFEWLFAFERVWYRTRALDLQWEMANEEQDEPKDGLRRELDDLADVCSQRLACLVHVRDIIMDRIKMAKEAKI
ncbi:hypothetical protein PG989_008125 [Apiospora arundinis]|uniref:RING-type domain-containing protein n=1 Tax=Apiospora arundinis TaxID=335852 RepID=A0ABR2J5M0_9PEZI